jgi:hypothetical protein
MTCMPLYFFYIKGHRKAGALQEAVNIRDLHALLALDVEVDSTSRAHDMPVPAWP